MVTSKDNKPEVQRIGPRRVRTAPVPGQQEEPDPLPSEQPPEGDRDKLIEEKPPHY
jgi:hypothetical protein